MGKTHIHLSGYSAMFVEIPPTTIGGEDGIEAAADWDDEREILTMHTRSEMEFNQALPKDFITEKTESDLTTFSKDDMKEIQTITQSMKSRKQEKMQTLVQDMVLVNENGVDAFKISKELNTIGVETITPEQVMEVAKTINTNQVTYNFNLGS